MRGNVSLLPADKPDPVSTWLLWIGVPFSTLDRSGAERTRVLTIAVPAARGHENGVVQRDLGEQRLVVIHAGEFSLEAAEFFQDISPNHGAARHGQSHFVPDVFQEHSRWGDDLFILFRRTDVAAPIAVRVFRFPGPTEPK